MVVHKNYKNRIRIAKNLFLIECEYFCIKKEGRKGKGGIEKKQRKRSKRKEK